MSSKEVFTIDGNNFALHKDKLFNLNTEILQSFQVHLEAKASFHAFKERFEIATAKNERICFMTLSTKYDIVKGYGSARKNSH